MSKTSPLTVLKKDDKKDNTLQLVVSLQLLFITSMGLAIYSFMHS